MPYNSEIAREVFLSPNERIILDFYEGPVQAVYRHDEHGSWYVFAMPGAARKERLFCLRPLADASVADSIADFETIDEVDWLTRLGRDTLLPACAPVAYRLRQQGRQVLEVVDMTEEQLRAAVPMSATEFADE